MTFSEDDFNKLAAAANQRNKQQEEDPWADSQSAPTVVQPQQPSELQQWQSAYQELAGRYNGLVDRVQSGEFSQTTAAPKQMTSILAQPWLWGAVAVAVLAIAGGLASSGGNQQAKKPEVKPEQSEQAIAPPTPSPLAETINSSASTVMITIPGEGMAAAVLAEPSFEPNPGNIAGSLGDRQTAELTGKTKDKFSEIKWGDSTKWISTCYTKPEGCSNNQPVGDLRQERSEDTQEAQQP